MLLPISGGIRGGAPLAKHPIGAATFLPCRRFRARRFISRPKNATRDETTISRNTSLDNVPEMAPLILGKPEKNLMDCIDGSLSSNQALEQTTQMASPQQWVAALSEKMVLSERMQGLILLNIMTFIMSTNFVVVKDAEAMMDPFCFSAARFVTAALPFLPFLAQMKIDKRTLNAGVEIGLWSTLGYLTQGIGLMSSDASRISFLSALTVILVPIIVGISGRGVSKTVWGSAAVALVGVSLLSETGMGGTISYGDLMGLASAAFIAMQVIRTEHYSRCLPRKSQFSALGISMISVALWSSGVALAMHPETVLSTVQHLDSLTPEHIIAWSNLLPGKALLFTGFISTDIVLLIEFLALKNVESTDAAIIYTMEPVLGALWAYLLLGERWGPNGWIGAALILSSSFVTQVYGSGKKNEVSPES